jgi:hypothetical protein
MVKLIDQIIYNQVSGNSELNPDLLDPGFWLGGETEALNIINVLNQYEIIREQLDFVENEEVELGTVALNAMMELGIRNPNANFLMIARNAITNYRSGAGPSNQQPPRAPTKKRLTREEAIYDRINRMAREEEISRHRVKKRKIQLKIASNTEKDIKRNNQLKHNEDTCLICLDTLNNGNSVCMIYECEHLFHCSCITQWADVFKTDEKSCPKCRSSFLSANLITFPEPSASTTTDGTTIRNIIEEPEVNSFGKMLSSDLRYLNSLCTKGHKSGC